MTKDQTSPHIPMKILVEEMMKLNKLSKRPSQYYNSFESIYNLYGKFASVDHFNDFLTDLILFRQEMARNF